MARGAVVVIISDGWDTGDPEVLRREMERLSLVAFRIVWVNPRTKSAAYQPLAGGMAAAWPYCDAVVSAHTLDALDDLAAALADPVRRRAAMRPASLASRHRASRGPGSSRQPALRRVSSRAAGRDRRAARSSGWPSRPRWTSWSAVRHCLRSAALVLALLALDARRRRSTQVPGDPEHRGVRRRTDSVLSLSISRPPKIATPESITRISGGTVIDMPAEHGHRVAS